MLSLMTWQKSMILLNRDPLLNTTASGPITDIYIRFDSSWDCYEKISFLCLSGLEMFNFLLQFDPFTSLWYCNG